MNRYESVILVKPILNEEELNEVKNKFFNLVKDQGGKFLLDEKEYGFVLKKTAYEVKKFNKANYLVFQFEASSDALNELERIYRISDEVIKYMSVKIDEDTKLVAKFAEDAKETRKSFKQDSVEKTNAEKPAEEKTEEVKEENKEEK